MTTTDQTPDAIRAAIADDTEVIGVITEALVWESDRGVSREAATAVAPKVLEWISEFWCLISADSLDRLGAVPAAGSVTISRETARRAHSALVYLRVAKDEMQDDEEQRAERELASALTNGADDGA